MTTRDLTELEGAVLGVVWADGPLSTYAIRSAFAKSRSSHFNGSAGAIYPLVERLKELGLIDAVPHSQGGRESHRLSITTAGKQALRRWLAEDKAEMAKVEFDPIRTRVHFLGALTSRQRERFLQESIESLEQEFTETELLIAGYLEAGDEWSAHGAEGALCALQARLGWLRGILEAEDV